MLTNNKLKQAWIDKVIGLMEELGAIESTLEYHKEYAHIWSLETRAGTLQVTQFYPLYLDIDVELYCRWLDAPRAVSEGVPCNPCSGKWNFHYDFEAKTPREKKQAIETAIDDIRLNISQYLP